MMITTGSGTEPAPEDPFHADYLMWRAKVREWWAWHLENPEVWEYFKRFAFEVISHGKTKTSHWLIINRIRWEIFISTTRVTRFNADGEPEDFKICNDYFAFYARLWKHMYPEHAKLLKTKRMIGEPADSPLIG